MGLLDDLTKDVAAIFKPAWTTRNGNVVPSDDSVKLGNDAVKLKATVLYADMADSTVLVNQNTDFVAAEFYKTFLHCAAKIIRSQDGVITAYDGDRIMAVYIGDLKNTRAVRTAFKINHAMNFIVKPAQQAQYPLNSSVLKHVVGIDTSDLFVAKTGVRGANDLVWVGRAANYAAKLAALPDAYQTYITKEVFDVMAPEVKTWITGQAMWEPVLWDDFDNRIIYRSNWWWNVDLSR
jgi:class 3 adenylate cyclase